MKDSKTPMERFFDYVRIKPNGCWEWSGATNQDGYGTLTVDRRKVRAHKFGYENLVGPVPEGKELDHKCRNTACVNPDHLEVVTHQMNLKRGAWGQKEHCPQGHPYNEENTYVDKKGKRSCRVCQRERMRRYREVR